MTRRNRKSYGYWGGPALLVVIGLIAIVQLPVNRETRFPLPLEALSPRSTPIDGTLRGRLEVTVRSALDSRPIEGARIELSRAQSLRPLRSGTTDAEGYRALRLRGVPPLELRGSAPGYLPSTLSVTNSNPVELYLKPVAKLSGSVVRSERSDHQLTLALTGRNFGATRVLDSDQFSFTTVPAGLTLELRLIARATTEPNPVKATQIVEVEALTAGEHRVLETVRLKQPGRVEGRVLAATSDGSGVGGLELTLKPQTDHLSRQTALLPEARATSDAEGVFVFEELIPGSYALTLEKSRHFTGLPVGVEVREDETVELELKLPEGIPVSGQVILDDGEPAPAAEVVVKPEGGEPRRVQTDETGDFSYENVPQSPGEIVVTYRGLPAVEIAYRSPGEIPNSIRLDPGATLLVSFETQGVSLPESVELTAIDDDSVADEWTIPGELFGGQYEVQQGRLRIEPLPEGTANFRISAPGFGPSGLVRAELYSGETTELLAELTPGPRRVALKIVDLDGRPIRGAICSNIQSGENSKPSDAQGKIVIGIESATQSFVIECPGYASRTVEELLTKADQDRLEVALERSCDLRVVVVDAQGRPRPSFLVRCEGEYAMTDQRGMALLTGLGSGLKHVTVENWSEGAISRHPRKGSISAYRDYRSLVLKGGLNQLRCVYRDVVTLKGRVLINAHSAVGGALTPLSPGQRLPTVPVGHDGRFTTKVPRSRDLTLEFQPNTPARAEIYSIDWTRPQSLELDYESFSSYLRFVDPWGRALAFKPVEINRTAYTTDASGQVEAKHLKRGWFDIRIAPTPATQFEETIYHSAGFPIQIEPGQVKQISVGSAQRLKLSVQRKKRGAFDVLRAFALSPSGLWLEIDTDSDILELPPGLKLLAIHDRDEAAFVRLGGGEANVSTQLSPSRQLKIVWLPREPLDFRVTIEPIETDWDVPSLTLRGSMRDRINLPVGSYRIRYTSESISGERVITLSRQSLTTAIFIPEP